MLFPVCLLPAQRRWSIKVPNEGAELPPLPPHTHLSTVPERDSPPCGSIGSNFRAAPGTLESASSACARTLRANLQAQQRGAPTVSVWGWIQGSRYAGLLHPGSAAFGSCGSARSGIHMEHGTAPSPMPTSARHVHSSGCTSPFCCGWFPQQSICSRSPCPSN